MDSQALNTIFNLFRTHNIILYVLLISSGVITFDLFGLRGVLGVKEIGQPYLAIIGILFIFSLSGFVFILFNSLFGGLTSVIRNYFDEKKFKKELDSLIKNLTNKEIIVLSLYVIEDANTIWLPLQAPEVTSLVSKRLIFMASKYGRNSTNGMMIFHYSIDKETKEKFRVFLSEFFPEPWQENYHRFCIENEPGYLKTLSETKNFWGLS